jgi:D-serine deaminase-like pyridoxal phosphate-dependent protein
MTEMSLGSELIDFRFKGFPAFPSAVSQVDVSTAGWNALRDLMFPILLLKESALQHNLNLMQRYCDSNQVSLAPHGKTAMSPQLMARQLDAGAWAITAANPSQVRVMRAAGINRILIANEVVDPIGLRWLASELTANSQLEVYCLVDSLDGVQIMDTELGAVGFGGELPVLVEMGFREGRAGCRSIAEAMRVADAVTRSQRLCLAGVEAYEGVVHEATASDALRTVDSLLADVRRLTIELHSNGAFRHRREIVVSAGGTAYFDRAVNALTTLGLDIPVRVVLRGGCYLTHDHDNYDLSGPMGTRLPDWERFQAAFELWGLVQSQPEPNLAIVGFGRRDASFDRTLPRPIKLRRRSDHAINNFSSASVFRVNDHHAYVRVDADQTLAVGDLVGCGLSHPCTIFDKWRLIPVVDDSYSIVSVVQTFF